MTMEIWKREYERKIAAVNQRLVLLAVIGVFVAIVCRWMGL